MFFFLSLLEAEQSRAQEERRKRRRDGKSSYLGDALPQPMPLFGGRHCVVALQYARGDVGSLAAQVIRPQQL